MKAADAIELLLAFAPDAEVPVDEEALRRAIVAELARAGQELEGELLPEYFCEEHQRHRPCRACLREGGEL